MNDAALPAAATIDPITTELIGSALSSIVEEMGEALIRASYSTNIKERRDCSTALFDVHGNTLCQAEHIPMHLGSFLGLIPHIMKRHPIAGMQPGDVFCGNDAYEGGGTHLPDIVLAEPVFVDGTIIALAVNLAHHADFADRGHAHIYQEGLRIPPVRLYRAGELQTRHQAADPAELPGAARAAVRLPRADGGEPPRRAAADRAVCEIRPRHRAAPPATPCRTMPNAKCAPASPRFPMAPIASPTATTVRKSTASSTMSCEITVAGDEMHLQFDAAPQVRAGLNMTYTALLSTVYYAVKALVDPSILPNAGLARPLHVTAPEGTIVNCVHPAAVNGRLGACQRVVDLIHGALAAGDAGPGDRGNQRRLHLDHLRRAPAER